MEVSRSSGVPLRVAVELTAAAGLTSLVAFSLSALIHLPDLFAPLASVIGVVFVALVGACWVRTPGYARPPGKHSLGAANLVTLTRGVLVCVVSAFIPFSDYAANHGWVLAWVCLIALVMDGADGATARRTRSQSAFGARFDMELDAFLTLVLCALLMTLDKAAPWVLLIGLARYGFVIAGTIDPRLARHLPDSFRRKAVCVWQLVTLMVCLLPPVSAFAAGILLAVALALLVYSFGRDVFWLLRPSTMTQGDSR